MKKLNDRVRKVDKSHYQFRNYVNKHRLLSIWHQLDEVFLLNPSSILELGIGPGLFKLILSHFGYVVTTVDIDPELKPDYVASATEIPIADNSYDCVCSFQMLEHLPYEQSLIAFSEMVRIARNNITITIIQPFFNHFEIMRVNSVIIRSFRKRKLFYPLQFPTACS